MKDANNHSEIPICNFKLLGQNHIATTMRKVGIDPKLIMDTLLRLGFGVPDIPQKDVSTKE